MITWSRFAPVALQGVASPYGERLIRSTRGSKEPMSGLEPLTCSLRIRFDLLYLGRKVAYIPGKMFAACRRVTFDYAHVSVSVSVRQWPTGIEPATFGS